MTEPTKTDQLILNELFDHSVFTATKTSEMRRNQVDAINAYQRPIVQQRVNRYLQDLLGAVPVNFQDNLFLPLGADALKPAELHVLLATLKAIINTPELQNAISDRVIAVQPIVNSVYSVVPELPESKILPLINRLFVDQLRLLTVDRLEDDTPSDAAREVAEFWDVSPDFIAIAQNIVVYLQSQQERPVLSGRQQVNQYLLTHRYLDAAAEPALWTLLQDNLAEIAGQWRPLARFYLEVGDDYALLLDATRQMTKARAYFVAVAVAKSMGGGLPDADLAARINQLARQLYPHVTVASAQVRAELTTSALAVLRADFWQATPLAGRVAIELEEGQGFNHD